MTQRFEITQIDGPSSTAYFVRSAVVNWVVLQDDTGLTLIDGGYPRQAQDVLASIREIGGSPEDVRGALLTHAHVDHLGGLARLSSKYGFPVFTDPAEAAHARREHLQQAGPLDIMRISHRPRTLRWLAATLPLGILDRGGIPDAQPFPIDEESGAVGLPGHPVPVASPGHTDGHSAYLVAGGRALVSGDALVTDHETSKVCGPQCLSTTFTHDLDRARLSIEEFTRLDADVLMPGHGPIDVDGVAAAARRALQREH